MNFHVMTLFPEMMETVLSTSILGRAEKRGCLGFTVTNIRDFAGNRHGKVDDYPYGGGAGILIQPAPVVDCFRAVAEKVGHPCRCIYTSPQGKTFTQEDAWELSREEDLIFLCGHYEGIDERALDICVTDTYSVGDYVLTGGELPVLTMIDAIARLVPEVLHNEDSNLFDSFTDHLLEYPQYTRPEVYEGRAVPEVLLSGHHAKIEEWRRKQSLERTFAKRPDLLKEAAKAGELTRKDLLYLSEIGWWPDEEETS